MPAGPGPYIQLQRLKDKYERDVAALQARIERLEGQVRDLGGDPVD